MKILVTGDREWRAEDVIERAILHLIPEPCSADVIIQGGARGADTLAWKVAKRLSIRCITYAADWKLFGKAAGPIRNRQMLAEQPDVVLAFHDCLEESKGTKDMISIAKKKGLTVILVNSHGTEKYV